MKSVKALPVSVKALVAFPPVKNIHVKSCIDILVVVVTVACFGANKVFNAVVVNAVCDVFQISPPG